QISARLPAGPRLNVELRRTGVKRRRGFWTNRGGFIWGGLQVKNSIEPHISRHPMVVSVSSRNLAERNVPSRRNRSILTTSVDYTERAHRFWRCSPRERWLPHAPRS